MFHERTAGLRLGREMTGPTKLSLIEILRDSLEVDKVAAAHDGKVPEGDFFAADLARIVNSPLCRLPSEVKEAAMALGEETRAAACRYIPIRRGQYCRVDGLRSRFPEFCCVFGHLGYEGDDTWIRVALVETAIQKNLPRDLRAGMRPAALDTDDRNVLGSIAYQPPQRWGEIFHKLVVQLGEVLLTSGGAIQRLPKIPDVALAGVDLVSTGEGEPHQRVRAALVNGFGYIAGIQSAPLRRPGVTAQPVPAQPRKRPPNPGPGQALYIDPVGRFPIPDGLQRTLDADSEAPPPEDFADFPIFARAPTPQTVLQEEGDDCQDLDDDESPGNQTAKACEQEAEAAHMLFLSGSLQPEVARVLAPPIYAAVMTYAEAKAFEGAGGDISERTAWMVLIISGLTSRSHELVVAALRRYAEGGARHADDSFAIDRDGFWSRLSPAKESDRKAKPARLPGFHFAWPTTFAEKFWKIWSSRSDWSSVLSGDLESDVRKASQALRDEVFREFSLRRLRNTLASAVYTGCGDDGLAQIAAGHSLGHTNAKLHYYSNVQGRMHRQFAWALAGWLPRHWSWVVRCLPCDETVFGLPRSRLPDAQVSAAIECLAARADELPPPRAGSADLCLHHNQLTAYVVAFFAACTAHRLTQHLQEITRRNLILRWASHAYGVATFLDKLTVCALSSRAAALSPMVVVQIEVYLAHLSRLVGRLERQGRRHRHAIQALKAAISGDGPLFVDLEHDDQFRGYTTVRPFTTSDLSRLWPEWNYPGYVLRHRHASFGWRFGLNRDDVTRQMGHAVEGVAFDSGDPDSAIRCVERLALARPGEKEAPLDRALRIEGWRVVRSWIAERLELPESAPDRAEAIMAEQSDVMRKHEKLQSRVTGLAMGKTVVVDESLKKGTPNQRRSLFESAREFARSKLDEWLALPEQQVARDGKVLLRDDVERLMEFATGSMPDRRYLVPVTNVLRNRLQRLRSLEPEGWKVQLPAPVSVLRVAPPVITPACARAYNHCASVLTVCDRWVLDQATQSDPHPDSSLGVAAIQLALRNGITRRDILLEVLQNGTRLRRHPFLPDTLLVPFGLREADAAVPGLVRIAPEDAAKEREANATDGDDDDDYVGEYVAVQGIAAICYLRWVKSGTLGSKDEFPDRLSDAISMVFPRPDQQSSENADGLVAKGVTARSKLAALEGLLACAQLSRRLTMPGIRSAWEDGRLAARTVDLDRQIDAWRGDVRRVPDESSVISPTVRRSPHADPASTMADILEKLCKVTTPRASEVGRSRSGKALIAEIENIERELLDIPTTARWVIGYLKSRLEKIVGSQRATLYEDYTVWRRPFLAALGETELADLDPEAMTQLLVNAIGNGSDPGRVLKVTRGIIKQLLIDGFEPPDMAELCQAAKAARPLAAAYLVSQHEAGWVDNQLRRWAEHARHYGPMSGIDAFDIDAASELWDLQYWAGMRTGEGVHLRHAEVIQISGEWFVCMRRIRRRGAKTDASIRVLRLAQFLPADRLERFENFVVTQKQAHRRRNDPSVGIFARPELQNRIAAKGQITRSLNTALKLILPPRSGRPYAGRHARASFAVHSILPAEHRSPGWFRPEAPPIPAYLRHLPLRFQLRFVSRALGHAYTTSSLTFYTHSLADLRMLGRGWERPSRALLAAACGENASTLGVRLSRAGISARDAAAASGMILGEMCSYLSAYPPATAAPFEVVPPASRIQTGTIEQMALWVREWMSGERLSILQHRHAIGAELMRRHVREIERLDDLYRVEIVDRSVSLDGIDKSVLLADSGLDRRGPRLPRAPAIARILDTVERKTPEVWSRLIEDIRSRRKGFARAGTTYDPEVRAILSKVSEASYPADEARHMTEAQRIGNTSNCGEAKRPNRDLAFIFLLVVAREHVRLDASRLAPS